MICHSVVQHGSLYFTMHHQESAVSFYMVVSLWSSCFHFVIIPPTVRNGIFSSEKLPRLATDDSTMLEFTELLRKTHSFINIYRSCFACLDVWFYIHVAIDHLHTLIRVA